MHLLALAFVSAPATGCPLGQTDAPPMVRPTLVGRFHGPQWYKRDGVDTYMEPGAAVLPSLQAALDLVEPFIPPNRFPPGDELVPGPLGASYLVVWWLEGDIKYPTVESVWVRPAETLVSLLSRPRERQGPHAVEPLAITAVQIFWLPPGDYPPAGLVFTEVQWAGDEDQDGPEDGIQ